MPSKDKVHTPIRNAIEKDGWKITNEPYTIDVDGDYLFADLRAEKR